MNNIVGYCTIDKNASTGIGLELDSFIGKDCRVLEFSRDGGVLVINNKATAIATFDKKDVYRKFECMQIGEYIMPPNLNFMEQTIYMTRVLNRTGGYNSLLKNMVIQHSLMRGKFNDSLLFHYENNPEEKIK